MALRRQLERLLDVGQMRNVEIQVLPLDREDNAGLGGPFQIAAVPGTIHVHDSKNKQGPQLAFGLRQWAVCVSYAADH